MSNMFMDVAILAIINIGALLKYIKWHSMGESKTTESVHAAIVLTDLKRQ